jgi:formylglycine-generating enzyme required for sulfatase activity
MIRTLSVVMLALALGTGAAYAQSESGYVLPRANETAQQRQTRFDAWRTANPDAEERASATARASAELVAAYIAAEEARRLAEANRDPFAEISAQSAALPPERKFEAQGLFASSFTLWQSGDFNAASIGFERGLAIDPANGQANFYFGDILARRSENERAAEHYRRAVAFGGSAPEALRAEAALRALPAPPPRPDPVLQAPPMLFQPEDAYVALWDCALCPELVVLPAASFTMGSPANETGSDADERPQRRVTIAYALAVGRFEVTQDEWNACVSARGCPRAERSDNTRRRSRGRYPAENVTWDEAQAYVQWLSQQTGHSYRLLTEAEWEYAARADTTTAVYWGAGSQCGYSNGADLSTRRSHPDWVVSNCDDRYAEAAPVGSFSANSFGLHDMLGNVWEWVEDCYGPYPDAPSNGSAPAVASCQERSIRGGSFLIEPRRMRAAYREAEPASLRNAGVGVRVARVLGP